MVENTFGKSGLYPPRESPKSTCCVHGARGQCEVHQREQESGGFEKRAAINNARHADISAKSLADASLGTVSGCD